MKVMKEKTLKIKAKSKETDTEMLARLVKHGFDQMDKRFEQVDKRFEQVDKRFERIEGRLDHVDERLGSLEYEQRETNRRLDAIEKKQAGVLKSLDEAITRKEFQVLASRVSVLEKTGKYK